MAPREPRLKTSEVSDALDQFGVGGALGGFFAMLDGSGVSGRALPVRLRERKGSKGMKSGLKEAIGAAPPGSVLVISSDSDRYSVWGGLMSWRAVEARLRGVVVDGCVRDAEEIRTLGLPVFARGRSPVSGYGRIEVTEIGGPVSVGGITVKSGDWVVADSDGVAFIPKKRVEAVLRTVRDAAASEAQEKKGRPVRQRRARGMA